MMKRIKTVDIGRFGEDVAINFLKKNRYKIIARNLHISHNEIDAIATLKKQKIIVFVEIKARSVEKDLYSPFGTPASAVTKEKQQRTLSAARGFLKEHVKFYDFQPRFDVVEVYLSKEDMQVIKVNHIENAFSV